MSDLGLYQRALKLCPDLWYATQLVERIQNQDVFPINTLDDLVDVLSTDAIPDKSKGELKLDGATLTSKAASKLFPVKYLPIADEDDLLVKLYAAFLSAREILLLEAKARHYRRSISEKKVQNV